MDIKNKAQYIGKCTEWQFKKGRVITAWSGSERVDNQQSYK